MIWKLLSVLMLMLAGKGEDYSEQMYHNYVSGLRNHDSYQNYIVIRAKLPGKADAREVCVLGCFFRQALHKEWNMDFDKLNDDLVMAKAAMNNPRLFEFTNEDAMMYLNVDLYTEEELKTLEKELDFNKLSKTIRLEGSWQKSFGEDEKSMRMYAHALFNRGLMCSEDITAGNGILYIK